MTGAVCDEVDPEFWFSPQGRDSATSVALGMTCPLRQECLEQAMVTPVSGLWSGTTEPERRQLARAAGRTCNTKALGLMFDPTGSGTEAGERRHRRTGKRQRRTGKQPCGPCRSQRQQRSGNAGRAGARYSCASK